MKVATACRRLIEVMSDFGIGERFDQATHRIYGAPSSGWASRKTSLSSMAGRVIALKLAGCYGLPTLQKFVQDAVRACRSLPDGNNGNR
jgi:hypothetical protein